MNKCPILVFLCIFLYFAGIAQEKAPVKFNHVSIEDFDISKLKVDTSYGAVIIADIGSSSFKGNQKGWFTLVYTHQRRIKIINKKGFDLSSVEIPLYISSKSNSEETIENLKASTYNIENGVVVETKLKKEAIFKDKQDKNHLLTKFTLPVIKEGSIVEYSYTINSDFLFNLQPWTFQGDYPRVWSEYNLDLPNFFEYAFMFRGYNNFDIKTNKKSYTNYVVNEPSADAGTRSQSISVSSENSINRWVIKNVPVLKNEKFTAALENHISKLEFQMAGQKFPDMPHTDIMGNWETLSKKLLEDEDFGLKLAKGNPWLSDDMKDLKTGTVNQLEQAKKIYAFVKNNFKSKGNHGIYLSVPIKESFKVKTGYVADVNLLLTAMLKHENIDAEPIILSTRSNGFANQFYPLINRFNYVICQANIDGVNYYLDASKPYLGFNKLPEFCYNGAARVVNTLCTPVFFYADSVMEQKMTSIMLFNNAEKPGKWEGQVNKSFGYYESCEIREQFLNNGKEAFEKKLKETFSGDYAIDKIHFEAETNYESPMRMSHTLTIDGNDNNKLIYFNPMVNEGYHENLFKSAERKYPVEMPCQMDDTYLLQIEIPEGYIIDELPKSAKVSLNEGEGFFEYLISKSDKEINLRTRIKLKKATFLPEDYETLRNFFDFIVKKDAEQIVFKKK